MLMDGKVAIITGAARGQGAAEARLFAEAGAKIVLTDLAEEAGNALAAELGENAIFIKHDVASEANWRIVADAAIARFGRIDALVNNAGITGYKSVLETDANELQRYLGIHVFGPHFGIQAVVPAMRQAGGGAIVNIVSTAALRANPDFYAYGVSKWGLRGLTRYAAKDLVGFNIRVNAILPGGVETPMLGDSSASPIVDAARAAVPMKRFAQAEEIGRVALFLCSDYASYMTGTDVVVDGGLNA
jgi:3alpha(or 20beta)-hydroxysteroid dehydrogenase